MDRQWHVQVCKVQQPPETLTGRHASQGVVPPLTSPSAQLESSITSAYEKACTMPPQTPNPEPPTPKPLLCSSCGSTTLTGLHLHLSYGGSTIGGCCLCREVRAKRTDRGMLHCCITLGRGGRGERRGAELRGWCKGAHARRADRADFRRAGQKRGARGGGGEGADARRVEQADSCRCGGWGGGGGKGVYLAS